MNAPHARRGGLEVWAPSVVPPIGIDLSDEQALAVAFRHLAGIGFAENMAGHITWQPDAHTQQTIHEQIGPLPPDVIRKISWENASRLYRHPVPAEVRCDPEAF